MIRIGFGKDYHNLIPGNKLVLGGVSFESSYQVQAHSDGDVIYHALSNAILSCIPANDIGTIFSDQDPKNQNLNSEVILDYALNQLKTQQLQFHNICLCVTCQHIKINPLREQILAHLTKKLTPFFQAQKVVSLSNYSF